MPEKFEIYDFLAILMPGVLVVIAAPICFPDSFDPIRSADFPNEFSIVGLIAASLFVGFLIQAIASITEKPLNWTWGGSPSDRALTRGLGDRYLPIGTALRIKQQLASLAETAATNRSLFLLAMERAENSGSRRVTRFNALYAYHRAMLLLAVIVLLLFLASCWGGIAARLTRREDFAISASLLLCASLFWYRTKQRGFYYVREVLLCAERQLAKERNGAEEGSHGSSQYRS